MSAVGLMPARVPTESVRTVAHLRRQIARQLATASSSAALDARILVAHVIGCTPNELALRDDTIVSDEIAARAAALVARRARGEPIARIVGEKEFYGLAFALSPETLIPRPDTETLVEAVLAAADRESPLAILDLGTGSGAILLALLASLPNARGVGVDLSPGAVATATANARRLGLAERASFVIGDWTHGIASRFDLVVANPPYIQTGAIPELPVEVRDHDPHLALDGGADGLEAYRLILSDLDSVLAESGTVFFEIGAGQAEAVFNLARRFGFGASFRRDLSGIDRVAVLTRTSPAGIVG